MLLQMKQFLFIFTLLDVVICCLNKAFSLLLIFLIICPVIKYQTAVCPIHAVETDESNENAGASFRCFTAPVPVSASVLHLLHVITGGPVTTSCQTQIRLRSCTEHHNLYSMRHHWKPACSGVTYLQQQHYISLFLTPSFKGCQYPAYRNVSFLALHTKGNAPSTPDGENTLHFLSVGRDSNFDGTF